MRSLRVMLLFLAAVCLWTPQASPMELSFVGEKEPAEVSYDQFKSLESDLQVIKSEVSKLSEGMHALNLKMDDLLSRVGSLEGKKEIFMGFFVIIASIVGGVFFFGKALLTMRGELSYLRGQQSSPQHPTP